MPLSDQILAKLILKYIAGTISSEEMEELQNFINESEANSRRFARLTDKTFLKTGMSEFYKAGKSEDPVWQGIKDKLSPQADPVHMQPRRSYSFIRYVAAAMVVVTTGLLAYQFAGKKSSTGTIKPLASLPIDVLPGSNKAVLTLADGSSIMLDSAPNGLLTQQGTTKINKLNNGQLAYSGVEGTGHTAVVYNTLSTPRSGQFKIMLPDGTMVWLNNASKLHYPTMFPGAERRVELTGEAYFEVAKDKAHPFRVAIQPSSPGFGGGTVEVLGTHFNIMAYPDENSQKTTLLEGSIKFSGNGTTALLKPGQQVDCNGQGQLKVLKEVDTEEVIAWKNGYFNFLHADVSAVMRQLARWYDVDVSYEGGIPQKDFNGKIPRNTHLAGVLEVLKMYGLNCRLEGKKLIVKE